MALPSDSELEALKRDAEEDPNDPVAYWQYECAKRDVAIHHYQILAGATLNYVRGQHRAVDGSLRWLTENGFLL